MLLFFISVIFALSESPAEVTIKSCAKRRYPFNKNKSMINVDFIFQEQYQMRG